MPDYTDEQVQALIEAARVKVDKAYGCLCDDCARLRAALAPFTQETEA